MNVLKVKKGETLARKQDKVMEWYLIQEGSVIRQFAFAREYKGKGPVLYPVSIEKAQKPEDELVYFS